MFENASMCLTRCGIMRMQSEFINQSRLEALMEHRLPFSLCMSCYLSVWLPAGWSTSLSGTKNSVCSCICVCLCVCLTGSTSVCVWWEKETGQGWVFPPCVSVHVNENDLALLMTATSNMSVICGETRINIFSQWGGCSILNTYLKDVYIHI